MTQTKSFIRQNLRVRGVVRKRWCRERTARYLADCHDCSRFRSRARQTHFSEGLSLQLSRYIFIVDYCPNWKGSSAMETWPRTRVLTGRESAGILGVLATGALKKGDALRARQSPTPGSLDERGKVTIGTATAGSTHGRKQRIFTLCRLSNARDRALIPVLPGSSRQGSWLQERAFPHDSVEATSGLLSPGRIRETARARTWDFGRLRLKPRCRRPDLVPPTASDMIGIWSRKVFAHGGARGPSLDRGPIGDDRSGDLRPREGLPIARSVDSDGGPKAVRCLAQDPTAHSVVIKTLARHTVLSRFGERSNAKGVQSGVARDRLISTRGLADQNPRWEAGSSGRLGRAAIWRGLQRGERAEWTLGGYARENGEVPSSADSRRRLLSPLVRAPPGTRGSPTELVLVSSRQC